MQRSLIKATPSYSHAVVNAAPQEKWESPEPVLHTPGFQGNARKAGHTGSLYNAAPPRRAPYTCLTIIIIFKSDRITARSKHDPAAHCRWMSFVHETTVLTRAHGAHASFAAFVGFSETRVAPCAPARQPW